MSNIHVLHENAVWTAPLLAALSDLGLPHRDWFLDTGALDLGTAPPGGVFYNRMSASAHTRDHRFGPEYAGAVIAWLESHDRRVVNGGNAMRLELSKVAQYAALRRYGIAVPRTLATVGREAALRAAQDLPCPFITKHNRGGKGLGVRLVRHRDELAALLDDPGFERPVDGILLLQDYIGAPEPTITRVEFVGGELLYAVRVDTSDGFELCPAEACALPGAAREKFEIVPRFGQDGAQSLLVERYRRFLRHQGIEVAGIEFIVDADGRPWTYDVNTNTNYNAAAEARAELFGMRTLAGYLGRELDLLAAADDGRGPALHVG